VASYVESPGAPNPDRRYWRASAAWGSPARRSAARSAIVRATRHAFPIALPDKESRSAARVRNAAASGVSSRNSLNFPDYLKLMTGFPSFQPEEVGAELLH